MADAEVVAAVTAEAETEQIEQATDAAVAIAEVEGEARQAEADAAVQIAEAQADAAVQIAEAQAQTFEVDETWLATQFAALQDQHQQILASQAAMAEAISSLALLMSGPPSTPTPPPPETMEEAPAEVTVITEPENVSVAAPPAVETPAARRRFRLM